MLRGDCPGRHLLQRRWRSAEVSSRAAYGRFAVRANVEVECSGGIGCKGPICTQVS